MTIIPKQKLRENYYWNFKQTLFIAFMIYIFIKDIINRDYVIDKKYYLSRERLYFYHFMHNILSKHAVNHKNVLLLEKET